MSDFDRVRDSSYTHCYEQIMIIESFPRYYLETLNMEKIRISAQLKLANLRITKLYYDRQLFSFESDEMCSYCNLNAQNDMPLTHAIFHCPMYEAPRRRYLNQFLNMLSMSNLLSNVNAARINAIFYFFIELFKIRNFIDF